MEHDVIRPTWPSANYCAPAACVRTTRAHTCAQSEGEKGAPREARRPLRIWVESPGYGTKRKGAKQPMMPDLWCYFGRKSCDLGQRFDH
ncbi:hypothetical protein L596_002266 [Steinernema carpocapsae]|uniref:Uncharacterized protein n=1 Tax=Steinernema carpocapsae TaxID=34508 RepID=A0A4U8UNS5_STECR|nr:hypothetical protein L596_002266 [Steinernema carpocapsae]